MSGTHPENRFFTRLTLLLLSSLTVMTGATLSAALPPLRSYFADLPRVDFWVRILLTTPALFIVISGPIAGSLIDRLGRKRPLILGVVIYGFAGLSGMVVRSLPGLLIGRAVLGMAVTVIFTAATALIADYYHGQARARFLGLQSAFMAVSSVVFIFLGGVLADIGWQYSFLIYGVALLILPLAIFSLFEPDHHPASENDTDQQKTLFGAVSPKVLFWIFGLTHLGQIIFYTIPVQLPFYLRDLNISSAGIGGLITGFNSLMMSLAGLIFYRIRKNISYLRMVRLTFGLITIGYLILGLTSKLSILLVGLAVAGLGLGLNNPNLTTWLVNVTPPNLRGRALGTRVTVLFLGQFLSPILAQPLINAGDIPLAYLAAAGLGGVILIFALAIRIDESGSA